MICGQTELEPLYSNVPLSCVPPIRLFCGCRGSYERLWNWSVVRPLFSGLVWSGIRFRSDLQYAVPAGLSPRVSHCADASTYSPFERTTPPSLPAMNCNGDPGTVTSAC